MSEFTFNSRLDGNNKPSEAYSRALAQGCCGFIDRKVENTVTGKRFVIGFNYGH
jgi:hypothetical protein